MTNSNKQGLLAAMFGFLFLTIFAAGITFITWIGVHYCHFIDSMPMILQPFFAIMGYGTLFLGIVVVANLMSSPRGRKRRY